MTIAFQKVATPVFGSGSGGSLSYTSASFTPNVAGSTLLAVSGMFWGGNGITASTLSGSAGVGSYPVLSPPGATNDNSEDGWSIFALTGSTAVSQTATTTTTSTGNVAAWTHIWEYSGVLSVVGAFTEQGSGTFGPSGFPTVVGSAVTVPAGSVLVAYCIDSQNDFGTTTITAGASGGVTPTTRDSATSTAFAGGYCVAEYVGTGTSVTPTFTTNRNEEHSVFQFLLTPVSGGGAAAFSGGAATAVTATGALSTAIKLAAGATSAVTAHAALLAQIKLAAAAASAISATGSLTTAAGFGAAALSAVTASGALLPFATVVLTSPLYTGSGGLLDPNFWTNSNTPAVGDTIWYDPTFITISPNGEIVSTSNNCSGIVQFNDGTGWAVGLVVITPLMVGYAVDLNSAAGALSTAINLAVAASNLTSASASLSTHIGFRSAASTLVTATGALTTQIQLSAAALSSTSATGILPFGQAVLVGAGNDLTTATGALSTQVKLASAASDVVSAVAALSAQIQMVAQAIDLTIASATFGIPQGAAFQSQAFDFTTAQAFLGNQASFNAVATDLTSATGQITTAIQLLSAAADVTTAAAQLGSQILFGFTPRLLTTAYFDPNLARIAGPLPYGEFSERVGDQLAFAIDWTGWLAIRWVPGALQQPGTILRPVNPNGFAYTTVNGGQSSTLEPSWPGTLGQTVNDGSIVWQCVPIDNTSLQATVSSVKWAAASQIGILGQAIKGQVALVALDLSGAIQGVDYLVTCAATFTDGETKTGKLLIKVR